MNLLLFGPNGCGKGIQGGLLEAGLGIAHVESGAILREHVEQQTRLGVEAQRYMSQGQLVPNRVTVPMVLEALKREKHRGWCLDGFPRTPTQGQTLWKALQVELMPLDWVVEIVLSRELAKKRVLGRRICDASPYHPNNTDVAGMTPVENCCCICGAGLHMRDGDGDPHTVDRGNDIYFDSGAGTQATLEFFKECAGLGQARYLAVDGAASPQAVRAELLKHIAPGQP